MEVFGQMVGTVIITLVVLAIIVMWWNEPKY